MNARENRPQFDRFARDYREIHVRNISISGEAPEYFSKYKARVLSRICARRISGARPLSILDFGAGIGNTIEFLLDYFPDSSIMGIDVSGESIDLARERLPASVGLLKFDGKKTPFPEGSFDVVLAACVLHHVNLDEHMELMREIMRVLRPGGLFVVFEHNPMNPITVKTVDACPLDEDAVLLKASYVKNALLRSGYQDPEVEYIVFFPAFLKSFRFFEPWLRWLPVGAQYCVAAGKPAGKP